VKTALALSYFDSEAEIPRLAPLFKHFDYVIAVDGRYEGYDVDHDFSIDNSEDLLRKYPNVILDRYAGWQVLKRQRYLDIAGELKCDFLIVVDTDEYLHPNYTDFPLFWRNLAKYSRKYPDDRLFRIKLFIPKHWRKAHNKCWSNRFKAVTRIHKDPGTMRYCGECHWMWCPKEMTDAQIVVEQHEIFKSKRIIEGVRLMTDSQLRDETKLKIRDKWAWWQMHEERRRQYYVWCEYNKVKHYPTSQKWEYDKKGLPIHPQVKTI